MNVKDNIKLDHVSRKVNYEHFKPYLNNGFQLQFQNFKCSLLAF